MGIRSFGIVLCPIAAYFKQLNCLLEAGTLLQIDRGTNTARPSIRIRSLFADALAATGLKVKATSLQGNRYHWEQVINLQSFELLPEPNLEAVQAAANEPDEEVVARDAVRQEVEQQLAERLEQVDLGGPALEPWEEFLSIVKVFNHSRSKTKFCCRIAGQGQQTKAFSTQRELAEFCLAEFPDDWMTKFAKK